jgi:hypothetical protein
MKIRPATLVTGCLLSSALAWGQASNLDRARQLFRQNRWAEARKALNGELGNLAPAEHDQAVLLLGLSQVKEAELYRRVSDFATEVGLQYLAELAESEENRDTKWLPLFTGIYQLSNGDNREAEKALTAALSERLPAEWSEQARLRLAVAKARAGEPGAASHLDSDASPQARYYAALVAGSRPNVALLEELAGQDLDAPDVEDTTDPDKVLRFFDPIRLMALERMAWDRAIEELLPLSKGTGTANKFARFYAGESLYFLGDRDEASSLLGSIDAQTLGPIFYNRARLLTAAASWSTQLPTAAELEELWQTTQAYPDVVLLWKEVERPEISSLEPFASKLDQALKLHPDGWGERADEAMVGRWGLTALRSGVDSSDVLHRLSRYRNHANKNKIEFNDPLLLVALSAANYENNDYAQALETLFELSKTFPGLRGLQWNLQGVYAARQKAAGDARITN